MVRAHAFWMLIAYSKPQKQSEKLFQTFFFSLKINIEIRIKQSTFETNIRAMEMQYKQVIFQNISLKLR